MTPFQKQMSVPALVAVTVAAVLMSIDNSFGPPPFVLPFKYGAIVVHIPWLMSLIVIGAGATILARRAGASLQKRVLVALSPALVIGGTLMAVVVTLASFNGKYVHPIDFIGHFLVGWLVFPAIALSLGALPFLRRQC